MNTGNAPLADLPQAVITPNAVLRAIGGKPDCEMKYLRETFIIGKQGGTLEQVRKVRDSLQKEGFITVTSYRHKLTEKGEKAFLLLPNEDVEETAQLPEPAMA